MSRLRSRKKYSREMAEAARQGLVVPSPEPLHNTNSDDIPQSAQKEKSHDLDSLSDNEALNMMHHPDSGELPDLASSGDEEEDGPSLCAQLRREIKQLILLRNSSSPAVEEAENTTDEDEDEDDDAECDFHTTVKKKRRLNIGPRAKKEWKRVVSYNTEESSQLEICVGLTEYAKQLYQKSVTAIPSGKCF